MKIGNTSINNIVSFKLQTKIIQVLREVKEQRMDVMEAFDIIQDELSKEFDEIDEGWRKLIHEGDF